MSSDNAYVRRDEMARIMGVSPATLDRLRKQGLPSLSYGRRIVRFHPPTVMRWLEHHAEGEG